MPDAAARTIDRTNAAPEWGAPAGLPRRQAWLRAFRRAVAARHEEITGVVADEIGKGVFECFVSEVAPLLRACRYAERAVPRLLRERRVAGGGLFSPGVTARECRVPLGRVGIIATWNYPVGLLGVQLVQALVCGNRVLVKPSERSPRSQALLLEIAGAPTPDAALPAGVLEVAEATREAGERVVALAGTHDSTPHDDRLDHIVFTGSTEVGRRIAATLAPALATSTLELSGRDSAIVLPDADADLAARAIWAAVRMNAGQTCMGPRRAIVCDGAYDAFASALRREVENTPRLRMVDESEVAKAQAAIDAGRRDGATVVQGGGAVRSAPLATQHGPSLQSDSRTISPTALLGCPPASDAVAGRHFGPVLAVVKARDEADALAIHASIDQRLATSLFTRDVARARRDIAPRLASTIVTINDCVVPTGHPRVTIGGLGPSGWGLSRGREGLLAMTRPVITTTTHPRFRTPTTLLEGKAAARFMAFTARVLGR
ncbi:MAG: aldehyde dehydrogenase [Phycisphaerales bacterium]